MKIYSFEKLDVWILSKELVVSIYTITKHFPRDEQFGLTNQLRRAALSISSNIAEGSGRTSRKDFAHFLQMAYSSTLEVLQQLIIAEELKYIEHTVLQEHRMKINEITLKLASLRKQILKTGE